MNEDKNFKKKKRRKKKKSNWPFVLVFILGLGILSYPMISDWYYRVEASNEVSDFQEARSELDEAEIARRMDLAQVYNDTLANIITEDPYSENKKEEAFENYARMLELHEKIGHIQIPRINIDIPVYAGTAEEVLQKGAGHLEGTSLPIGGNSTHSVITAHSGLPKARLFTDLHDLEVGDKFYYHNIEGTMAFQIDHIDVIDPSDFSQLLIQPGRDLMTLLTCTPVMINTHRLIVRGHRIDYIPEVEEPIIQDLSSNFIYKQAFIVLAVILLILLIAFIFLNRKAKRLERQLRAIARKQREIDKEKAASGQGLNNQVNKERDESNEG